MRLGGSVTSGWGGAAALAAALGGLLWMPYGLFEMLEPWGADVVYRDDLGYAVVSDPRRFVVYSLPGSLALLLTTLSLLGVLAQLGLPAGRNGRLARILASVALGLAVLSAAGVIALVDPLFTSGRVFGSLALGAATVLAGADAWKGGAASGWVLALLALGLMGILLLPLWPLVYAVEWVSAGAGAVFIALFGLGWMAVGYGLWSATS